MFSKKQTDDRPEAIALLAAIKSNLPALQELKEHCDSEWGFEDAVYRFYHGSFKVFYLQQSTQEVVQALRALAPKQKTHTWFEEIVQGGTGKVFDLSMNKEWLKHTRPIVEAFCHARYFLEMAIKSATLEAPPSMLPSGWGAVLYLYGLR